MYITKYNYPLFNEFILSFNEFFCYFIKLTTNLILNLLLNISWRNTIICFNNRSSSLCFNFC